MSKRDNYVAKMKLQLDEMNAQITAFETKAIDARQDAREKYDAEMTKLRLHSKAAVAKFDEITAASEASWHKMVSEMEKMRHALMHSLDDFKSHV